MDNKIKHFSSTQTIPEMEFKPLLRGESAYYGNLNRAPQSAYDLAETVATIQSWGGLISILQPKDQTHIFELYQIAKITDGEVLETATDAGAAGDRYGIVVAEAEIDITTNNAKNIVVCTFCPNFLYPTLTPDWTGLTNGTGLCLNTAATDGTYLTQSSTTGTVITALGSSDMSKAPIAIKTGPRSIFFSGTARIFGYGYTGV